MGTSTPKLGDVIDRLIDAYFGKIAGPMPARVEAYNPATQTADVQPLVKQWIDGQLIGFPILRGVTVAWPRTALGSITLPLAPGDEVLIVPSGVALGEGWQALPAGIGEPKTKRRFALGDCVAIVGIGRAVAALPATAYATGAVVVAGADIRLGASTAIDPVALAGLVVVELNKIIGPYMLHTHNLTVPPPVLPNEVIGAPTSPASTTTKAL